VKNIPRGENE
jgi:hypothetical protein